MIRKLKELNFRVTLWVHPFVSCRSIQFVRYWRRGFLMPLNILSSFLNLFVERSRFLQAIVDDFTSNPQYQPLVQLIGMIHQRFLPSLPGITLWWNGLAGVLDLSQNAVQEEYIANLKRLQKLYDIDSFKFDAGEVNWLPITSSLANPSCQAMSTEPANLVTSPALYPYLYAQLAHRIDATNRLQEVRVGYRTQRLPVFVRIIDKDSDWSYSNGLRSLLPSIFNLGLLGYPFILPDMVIMSSGQRKILLAEWFPRISGEREARQLSLVQFTERDAFIRINDCFLFTAHFNQSETVVTDDRVLFSERDRVSFLYL